MARRTPKTPPAAVAKPAKTAAQAIADVAAAPVAATPVAPEFVASANPATPALVADDAAIVADTTAKAVTAAVEAATTTTETIVNKAAEAVDTAANEAAPSLQKDVTTMATQFETPKMLNDATDRTQAAMEKGQKFVAEIGDFGKGNIEAMVEAGKIAAKGFETLGQDNADYTRRSFEGMTATFKTMASVKSPTEFFKLQSDYARSMFDGAVAQTSKNTEAMIKLASDAAQPLSNRFAVAVEKVKTAA